MDRSSRMRILVKTSDSSIVFGPLGNLGPIWVQALKEQGFIVHGFGLKQTEQILEYSGESFTEFDVTKFEDTALISKLIELRPSAIIINSGIDFPPSAGTQHIFDFEINSWKKIFDVNVFGVVDILNILYKCIDWDASVVLIGSIYANLSPDPNLYSHFNNNLGSIKHPAYASSKSALMGILRQFSADKVKKNIRLNMLSPGGIQNNQDAEFLEKFSNKTTFGRLGSPQELVSALKFLVDQKNSYMVGHNLIVDGGYSLC